MRVKYSEQGSRCNISRYTAKRESFRSACNIFARTRYIYLWKNSHKYSHILASNCVSSLISGCLSLYKIHCLHAPPSRSYEHSWLFLRTRISMPAWLLDALQFSCLWGRKTSDSKLEVAAAEFPVATRQRLSPCHKPSRTSERDRRIFSFSGFLKLAPLTWPFLKISNLPFLFSFNFCKVSLPFCIVHFVVSLCNERIFQFLLHLKSREPSENGSKWLIYSFS